MGCREIGFYIVVGRIVIRTSRLKSLGRCST